MKIMTILGTRPEIIRLSRIIPRLDHLADHTLVHTGQNFDPTLNDIFFKELCIRAPDLYLGIRADSFGEQIGRILSQCEKAIRDHSPDRLLVLGDTNSALSAIIAKRLGVPVFHMEAGNRCYDDRVPEEVNRRVIDQCSDILMPYTERSRANLIREGFAGECVYVTGNPILEVIQYYAVGIDASHAVADLNLTHGDYFLVTMHRAENVDVEDRLNSLVAALAKLRAKHGVPVIVSTHPHTRDRMERMGLASDDDMIRFLQPFGFFDFIALEKGARCVLSDSGTVQEECAILQRPSVTIRDVTERPETIECGGNILSGVDPDRVVECVDLVLSRKGAWSPPQEYTVQNVSETVANIVLGFPT